MDAVVLTNLTSWTLLHVPIPSIDEDLKWFICPEKHKSRWKCIVYSVRCRMDLHTGSQGDAWKGLAKLNAMISKTAKDDASRVYFWRDNVILQQNGCTNFLCPNHTVWGKELDMPLFWAWHMGWWFLNAGKWCFLQRNVQFPNLLTLIETSWTCYGTSYSSSQ